MAEEISVARTTSETSPMAEEVAVAPTTSETSPMAEEMAEEIAVAEETTAPSEESAPNNNLTDAPPEEEEKAKETEAEKTENAEFSTSVSDHKRKLGDLDGEGDKNENEREGGVHASEKKDEDEGKISEADDSAADAKRQRVDDGGADGLGADGGQDIQKEEAPLVGNVQLPHTQNIKLGPVETVQNSTEGGSQHGNLPSADQWETSRRIEVPNNKVGVLIGKAGETIRMLQNNSGAMIQITKDAEADLNSSTRPVELTGNVENINKAEQLIKNVIAEADAGGSPALVARGYGAAQSGPEVYEMQVPKEKVGMIIGKGGETIKLMHTRSHARIQLIPQHLPEGDFSKERIVRITGNKKQIEDAKIMIKDVMNQTAGRPTNNSTGHTRGHRPRGHAAMPQWGHRGPPTIQSHMQPNSAYDYPQRGAYPPQTTHHPQQSYGGGYRQQPPPRNNWEHKPAAPIQTPGGYDYYGQGGQAMGMGTQPSNSASAPTPAPVSYNYGPPQAAGYGQSNPYSQSVPSQQSYVHESTEPEYDNQAPAQHIYGQQHQSLNAQPGFYPQQGNTTPQSVYAQQPPYGKPPAYAAAPQSYGPASAAQPGDPSYQGQMPSSYGSGGPTQHSYPYGSSAPSSQPVSAYGQNYGASSADGYSQPPPTGYSQPSGQVAPGYGHGGQPVPAYTQPSAQSGSYGPYPPVQPAYGEQPGPNVNYGYQGGADAGSGYGNSASSSGYGAAPAGGAQPGYGQAGGYIQTAANPGTYDQSMAPQAGYGSAPAGYANGVSPQPGAYAGQNDSAPVYGHH